MEHGNVAVVRRKEPGGVLVNCGPSSNAIHSRASRVALLNRHGTNPSVERTANVGARLRTPSRLAPPSPAAHLKR